MDQEKERERELAYRFDLFIAPDWCERFDSTVAEHVKLPSEGRLLEINCGTGTRAIAVAAAIEDREVVGADAHPERLAIARAKALIAKADRCTFVEADPEHLGFEDESFDGVVADASLEAPERLAPIVAEAVRVARTGAPVAVKVQLRGSFDEFFSIYWEALYEVGIVEQVWDRLESIITAHPTFEQAVGTVRAAGVHRISTHRTKEEWRFESGAELLASPLVADLFLSEWLSIVPAARLDEVRDALERIIDRETTGVYVDISAKALVAAGVKS